MKAYRVQSPKEMEPFGEHPRSSLIGHKTVDELQRETLQSLGLELHPVADASLIEDADEHLIFDDRLYFTPALLHQFLTRSQKLQSSTICSLKPGVTTLRNVVATQDVCVYPDRIEYGLHYAPAKDRRGACQFLVIDPDQDRFSEPIPMPEHMFGSGAYHLPMTDVFMVQIDHWTNLWMANITYLLSAGARLKKAPLTRLLGLAFKARSFNRWKIFRQTNQIGRNCDIHPTAYIEGSIIGDNVKIGAGAVIRASQIGDNTFVANNVTVELSMIGEGCNLMNGAIVQFSVLYPGVFTMSRLISCSLCGRDTFLGDGSSLTDFRLDGKTMVVLKDGMRIDTENTFVGSCLGHRSYLGAGCILAPGRMVPNGWHIAPEEHRVLRTFRPHGEVPDHRLMIEKKGMEKKIVCIR
jgi:carbonic anhydrase/acetyltransferase-like protein (isoleucine patch superfamily)